MKEQPLCTLKIGQESIIRRLNTKGILRRRLLDLGFIPGVRVLATMRSPFGDPTAYLIHNVLIALRSEESSSIMVTPLDSPERDDIG